MDERICRANSSKLMYVLGFQMLIPTLPVYVKEIGGTSSNIDLLSVCLLLRHFLLDR